MRVEEVRVQEGSQCFLPPREKVGRRFIHLADGSYSATWCRNQNVKNTLAQPLSSKCVALCAILDAPFSPHGTDLTCLGSTHFWQFSAATF